MDPLLTALCAAEQQIVDYEHEPPPDKSAIIVYQGTQPILISAPHSTRHWRGIDWKQEEEYTAALGYCLYQATGATFIYGGYALKSDPHDDDDTGPYKRTLDDVIRQSPPRLVLDLHGARGDRDFAVALGTIHGETFAGFDSRLLNTFERFGFIADPPSSLDRLVMNPPRYTGGVRQPTITRYVWRQHHIPAVQIELSAWVRVVQRLESASNARNGSAPDFRGDGARIIRVFQALYAFIIETLVTE